MKRVGLRRWLLLCPLLYGCLVGMSCTQIARQAVFDGTIGFVSGQVSNTVGSFPISDLIIGLFSGQSSGLPQF